MSEERPIRWRRRVFRAIMTLFVNVISWVIVPVYVFNYISGSIPSSSLTITPTFIYVFGAVITGLQVLGALTEGMAPSIPLVTGSYIAVAYYIYVAVNGGTLTLTMAGTGVSLDFQPLFYLMVLPPLFSAIRTPMAYIAKENEATRPTSDSA